MKDLFSNHAEDYVRYRPSYPVALFQYLKELVHIHENAWDCGTGNGQVAGELSNVFRQVYATDISIKQLSQAVQKPNIQYTKQPAERTKFREEFFDLATVGQAVHWFDFDSFYREVKRVLKKNGIIAIFGYGLFRSNSETDRIIREFYSGIIGRYWQPERKYLDERYQTIPFPFKELEAPEFEMRQKWTVERLIGYLNTWSAVKTYEMENKRNPVELITDRLEKSFGAVGEVNFSMLLRVGINS